MAKIVFVLGRPGSGKSQIARCITGEALPEGSEEFTHCLPEGWEADRITDYKFLLAQFQEEKLYGPGPRGYRFKASAYEGFQVEDFTVLYEALVQVNAEILNQINEPQKLILIEFARDHYYNRQEIWDAFYPSIVANASFLYVRADLNECKRRVKKRVNDRFCEDDKFPKNDKFWKDDTFVPKYIMEGYYQEERYSELEELFGQERVTVIDNSGEWQRTWDEIKKFLERLFRETSPQPLDISAA